MDPRGAVIERRLAGVGRVLAVTGAKGGIGKSTVASLLALVAARGGARVGLLDLDLTSPSSHVVAGYPTGFPEEPFGIEPPEHAGVAWMSVAHFSGGVPAPLRGPDTTSALLELLAITMWGERDLLVLDMPPGLGDATLDVLRLVPRAGSLVLATPSRVVRATVAQLLRFLGDQGAPVVGVLENMARGGDEVAALAAEHGLPLLGRVPLDEGLEAAVGDAAALLGTAAARALQPLADQMLPRVKEG